MRPSNLAKHWSAALVAAAIGSGMLPAPGAHAEDGVTSSEIVVGAIGALTGPTAFIGAPGRDSMSLGFDEINAKGGVCGHKLKLQYENASSPAESLAAVKKLVEQDKIFILVLASGSTGAAAAADYVRQAGVPTYNLYGSTPIIRNPFSPNVFHGAIVPIEVAAPDLISLFYDDNQKPQKFGVLAGTYAFPQATLTAVKDVMNAKKLDYMVEQFDQSARDFTSQLVAFSRAKVDSVLVLGSFSEAGFAIKQARQLGLTNVQWVLDASAVNSAIIPIIGDADGLRGYFNVPAFPGQTPDMVEFEARLKKLTGSMPQGRPNVYDMIAYGSAYVMADAIKATGCELTRGKLVDAWSNLKDAGPAKSGGLPIFFPESFTPTDHQGNYRLGAAVVKDGKWQVYRVMEKP
jgi:branched-chain amino acid transport system substrate-binding protein